MTGTIIPLRPKRDAATALACTDAIAIELLTEGRALTLSTARVEAILMTLHAHRLAAVGVIADLQARSPSGHNGLDTVNADLSAAASLGLNQIEFLIEKAEACLAASRARDPAT